MLNEQLIYSSIAESIEYRLLLTTPRLLLVSTEEPGIITEEMLLEPFIMETWLISVVLPLQTDSSSSSMTSRPVAPRTELNREDEWREQSLTPLSLLSV